MYEERVLGQNSAATMAVRCLCVLAQTLVSLTLKGISLSEDLLYRSIVLRTEGVRQQHRCCCI